VAIKVLKMMEKSAQCRLWSNSWLIVRGSEVALYECWFLRICETVAIKVLKMMEKSAQCRLWSNSWLIVRGSG
jgi:hypothetical protein